MSISCPFSPHPSLPACHLLTLALEAAHRSWPACAPRYLCTLLLGSCLGSWEVQGPPGLGCPAVLFFSSALHRNIRAQDFGGVCSFLSGTPRRGVHVVTGWTFRGPATLLSSVAAPVQRPSAVWVLLSSRSLPTVCNGCPLGECAAVAHGVDSHLPGS